MNRSSTGRIPNKPESSQWRWKMRNCPLPKAQNHCRRGDGKTIEKDWNKTTSGHDRTAVWLSTQDQASQHSIVGWEEIHEPQEVFDKLWTVNGFWGRRISFSLAVWLLEVQPHSSGYGPEVYVHFQKYYEQHKLKLMSY